MNLYILNEKDFIRNVLASKKKPEELPMSYFITLIAKYYFDKDLDVKKLSDVVKQKILEFDLENYQEYKYHNIIVHICNDLFQNLDDDFFVEREYIPIYENELKLIETLQDEKQKKIMFTFFVVARYANCDGWINKKDSKGISEVFKLANVSLTSERRNELLHELYVNNYISLVKKVNNLNIRVKLDDTGDIVYKVKELKNIGNQYVGNFKRGYRQCKNCGRVIKYNSNKKMYCKKCAEESYQESKKNWWKNHEKPISLEK